MNPLSVSVAALGVAVLAAAICRLRYINVFTHKVLWVFVYLFNALGAAVTAFEAYRDHLEYGPLLLLIGIALALWGSRNSWRDGAPKFMEK